MLVVILIYDQLLFRPLVAWSGKFRSGEDTDLAPAESWLLNIFQRTQWLQVVGGFFRLCADKMINLNFLNQSAIGGTLNAPPLVLTA